jgi:hypothetical protein
MMKIARKQRVRYALTAHIGTCIARWLDLDDSQAMLDRMLLCDLIQDAEDETVEQITLKDILHYATERRGVDLSPSQLRPPEDIGNAADRVLGVARSES